MRDILGTKRVEGLGQGWLYLSGVVSRCVAEVTVMPSLV